MVVTDEVIILFCLYHKRQFCKKGEVLYSLLRKIFSENGLYMKSLFVFYNIFILLK